MNRPIFRGGSNIAIKLPAAAFEPTVAFYRDVLGLPLLDAYLPNYVFEFGSNYLWLDRCEHVASAEVWLELVAPDTSEAKHHLAALQVERCDEVEALPAGFDGFWIRSPATTVHLILKQTNPLDAEVHVEPRAASKSR